MQYCYRNLFIRHVQCQKSSCVRMYASKQKSARFTMSDAQSNTWLQMQCWQTPISQARLWTWHTSNKATYHCGRPCAMSATTARSLASGFVLSLTLELVVMRSKSKCAVHTTSSPLLLLDEPLPGSWGDEGANDMAMVPVTCAATLATHVEYTASSTRNTVNTHLVRKVLFESRLRRCFLWLVMRAVAKWQLPAVGKVYSQLL